LIPLIDADVICYQAGFAAEYKEEDGVDENGVVRYVTKVRDWDWVQEYIENLIRVICESTWADEEPLLFLTPSERVVNLLNNENSRWERDPVVYVPNFRESIAVTKPYKGGRPTTKPFHFDNILSHFLTTYDVQMHEGLEADDLLSIRANDIWKEGGGAVICSRDKDLRITPCMHYGWECGDPSKKGYQPAFGPMEIDRFGSIFMTEKKELRGGGLKFFYSQLITGDSVDNIPGIPRKGAVAAFSALNELSTEEEMEASVRALYEEKFGPDYEGYLKEQANLLWMIQKLDGSGNPVFFTFPSERTKHV